MNPFRRRIFTAAAAGGVACAALPLNSMRAVANPRPGTAPAPPALSPARGAALRGTPMLSELDGKPLDLVRYLGRPLLVNLWATWCAPCLAEMPSLQALRDAGGPQGSGELEVVALNAGQSINQVEGYLKTLPLRLPIVMDQEKRALARWNVRVLPTTLLFDAAGVLRATSVGERDWADARVLGDIRAILQANLQSGSQVRPRAPAENPPGPTGRANP